MCWSLLPISNLNSQVYLMIGFKDIRMLSWNIWGAHNNKAKRHLFEIIRKHSPIFLIILETHVEFSKTQIFWKKVGYKKVAISEARGHSGGIWLMQQVGSNVDTLLVDFHDNAVTIKLTLGQDNWFLTAIYASPVYAARLPLWQHLCDLRNNIDGAWLILGDFNEIMLPNEQRGGTFIQSRADGLLTVVDQCDLVDINMIGGRFTWHRY